jgi:hypothetical protein
MGQKVNPIAFRLDVSHRGQDSLMFRKPLRKERSANRSGTKDRLGWSHTFSGDMNEWAYGANLSYSQARVEYVVERGKSYGLVLNRTHVHVSQGAMELDVEWMPLDVEAFVGDMLDPVAVSREEGDQRPLATDTEKTDEIKSSGDSGSPSQTYEAAAAAMERQVQERKEKYLSRMNDLAEALVRVEALFEQKGMLLPEGFQVRTVTIRSLNLMDIAYSYKQWKKAFTHFTFKARLKGKEYNQRVKAKTLVAAFRRAGAHPVAPRVSRRVAMALEDAANPTKHSNILNDIRKRRGKCSRSTHFGLLGHREIGVDAQGRRLPPQVHGGYRGCRILVKGTIDGSRRTRKEVIQRGIVPLSTVSAPISSWNEPANTKTGSRGVQVVYCY